MMSFFVGKIFDELKAAFLQGYGAKITIPLKMVVKKFYCFLSNQRFAEVQTQFPVQRPYAIDAPISA